MPSALPVITVRGRWEQCQKSNYTFSYIKDGETKTLPARYSFTFVKDGENWMIVDHHSSVMPALPR